MAWKKIITESVNTVLLPFRRLYMSEPVWKLINKRGIEYYKKHIPVLSPVQRRLVDDLHSNGIARADFEELFPSKDFRRLVDYAAGLKEAAQARSKKPFILEYWDPYPVVSIENPFVELGLRSIVLDVVDTYLGQWAKFYYFMLGLSTPGGEGMQARNSQRWHRDPEDRKICKMFIYLNDVDENAGPFMYVKGSNVGGKWRSLFPQRPPQGSYPPDGEVEKAIPANEIVVCTGKAGTILFADTSGLHKGGYARTKERLMFTAGYAPKSAFGRNRYRLPAAGIPNLTERQQYSLRGDL